ncbi:hypothetical protein CXG81DRAFT_15176 [Caulochytrium protostelioides]|uniref:Myosin tail domain-containing protein n=1 Tax=Caulochytrium protostelioides TaxID=1555241 RepID=A0A4P9WX34_9FUNG|nr:hypothetical protein CAUPRSCDRAFT_5589 [Caulochytrium protostelioides]RKO98989.1 hypothetical protein CXG81DRAFT_15176 [Caulochytrium protostelioides]|eukprot:RKO98989.1 hypothetical protein CXG81DRAFT_15176 [Caulochytrium protostelioides]
MAEERCRRAEQILQEVQLEVRKQRDLSTDLEREKISLDKQIKELQARIIDFESAQLTSGATATRRLEARIEELQTQIEAEARDKTEIAKNYRKSERQNRELALTIADKDKAAQRLQDDLDKSADKMKKMKVQLDELESETATYQLVKRRMERETEELRERSMRFEKEAEKLKRTLDRGLVMPTTV